MVKIRLTALTVLTLLCGCQAPVRGAQSLPPLPAAPVLQPVRQPVPPPAPVTPPAPAETDTASPAVNSLIQATLTTAATGVTPTPAADWQPVTDDVQALAEQYAPRVAMPDADKANAPVSLLYAPYRQGDLLALRYFVLYQDEDLKASWEDKLYDLFRKHHYGSVTDIEPIEVYLRADGSALAGVAFKTGQNQAFYKILVRENDWLTYKTADLQASDRDGDHPRIGVSTWNHLHDLPSVLQQRPYPPTFHAPAVPVARLDAAAMQRWRFDVRHLVGGPKGDVRKLEGDRSEP
jgi:hypothetical protein